MMNAIDIKKLSTSLWCWLVATTISLCSCCKWSMFRLKSAHVAAGALCLPDIGQLFPDNNPSWKGASFDRFCEENLQL
jgi:hypothetical protein